MDIIGAIKGVALAIGSFFGWKQQKEINLPGQQKRDEVQQARSERDKNNEIIDNWIDGRKP